MESALVVPFRVRRAASLKERNGAMDDAYLESGDSAFCALTDFRGENPISVEVDTSIEDAYADMNRLGVHALLVTQQDLGQIDSQIIGLITAYDIERQRPHRSPRAAGFVARQLARVGDVMTPWNELSLVKYESLQALTAVDLYEMFQGTGLTHLLVVEMRSDDSAVARGVLSRAALARRLRRGRGGASI